MKEQSLFRATVDFNRLLCSMFS